MLGPSTGSQLSQFVSDIVTAYVGHNTIDAIEVPLLIQSVHRTLATLNVAPVEEEAQALYPAVPVKKSVFPDYIICLEDGRKLKMLKRHLKSAYNMGPDEYRAKWSLPPDYPLVAPNYAQQRSSLAKKIGLGNRPRSRRIDIEPTIQKIPVGRSGLKPSRKAK